MRHILVDHARARQNLKRGGGLRRVALSEAVVSSPLRGNGLIALDAALDTLAALDPRRGRVVELRAFGGLSVEETAHVLGVSVQTVMRDWKLARVWLRRELQRTGHDAT
jgi:RNA polymerase sigma factor (TIGR02999 family)